MSYIKLMYVCGIVLAQSYIHVAGTHYEKDLFEAMHRSIFVKLHIIIANR